MKSVVDPGEGPEGPAPPPPPLLLDQTEAGRAEKKFLEIRPPYLKVWMWHWKY